MTWNFLKAIAEIYILFCVATSIFFLSQREWTPGGETPETLMSLSHCLRKPLSSASTNHGEINHEVNSCCNSKTLPNTGCNDPNLLLASFKFKSRNCTLLDLVELAQSQRVSSLILRKIGNAYAIQQPFWEAVDNNHNYGRRLYAEQSGKPTDLLVA